MDSTQTISTYCVATEVIIFNIIGIFGNVQLLWTTMRKEFTHTKPGILLGMNAFYHTICLLSEIPNAVLLLSNLRITRRQCYYFIVLYIFVICQQATMMLAQSADLLIVLLFPVWYRLCPTKPYILTCFLFCTTFSLATAVWGWVDTNDEVIAYCNPPLGLPPKVSLFWSTSNIVLNSVVVLLYIFIILLIHFKGKSAACKENRIVIRRLKVIMIVYICSWYMAILGVNLGHVLGFSEDMFVIWQSNMVLFALMCYTQAFYVCIWRSLEYRNAFKEQLLIMACRPRSLQQNAEFSKVPTTKTVQISPNTRKN